MANFKPNYNDKRLTAVERDKKVAMSENEQLYGGMIKEADSYYDKQIDATRDYAETQKQNQQEQTDFAIEKINQQKAQARKDYLKEQSGAYVDWQKQSSQHGVNAEKEASVGLAGTGFSESSQVSMYNTYQTRVATAREAYQLAVLNYDNAIKDAILQNNAILAEIAYNALQAELELSLQGFQYKNQLLLDQARTKREIDQTYYGRYQDAVAQINHEISMAEQARQYNASMAFEREKFQYQKKKDAEAKASGGYVAHYSKKTSDDDDDYVVTTKDGKKVNTGSKTNTQSAMDYFEALIASGAPKEEVVEELALARKYEQITASEYAFLYSKFAPRGVQY